MSDGANFANTENVNGHNLHYWAHENPRWMRTVPFQHTWSVNCWYGMVDDHVIGPYFFEGLLTGQVYANILQNQILAQVRRSFYQRINNFLQVEGHEFIKKKWNDLDVASAPPPIKKIGWSSMTAFSNTETFV